MSTWHGEAKQHGRPADVLRLGLYQAFVELAEGSDKVRPLPGSCVVPLALPRAAVLGLLDCVAPRMPTQPCGSAERARTRWWRLRAEVSLGPAEENVTWQDFARALDQL
eukprot:TRINITY_DN61389_c0_g1_i1.p2 TRINITY_DN61389_c0_g1~~TRINITY_DN61389_c0_g1_i1.p2  ORF type:complete len:109 (+),score=16.38 TRINITY_DN61389_c0_g1_i1:76-402(+)